MAKKLDSDLSELIRLFDCYGALLTDRQRDVLALYYQEDLSLSEIAAELGITRQAVSDSLRHSEQQLTEIEEKLGLAHMLHQIRTICADESADPELRLRVIQKIVNR